MNFDIGTNSIKIIEYPGRPGVFDDKSSLNDGDINRKGSYGCILNADYKDEDYIIFEIKYTSNIYGYGIYYGDSGGSSGSARVSLYKQNNDDWELVKKDIKTTADGWFLLFNKLPKGTYKIHAQENYTVFTELYAQTKMFGVWFSNNLYILNYKQVTLCDINELQDKGNDINEVYETVNKIKECSNYNIIKFER